MLSLKRGTDGVTDRFDKQHWAATLTVDRCPSAINDINHMITNRGEVFLHHIDVHLCPPSFSCSRNSHSVSDCRNKDNIAEVQAKHTLSAEISDSPPAATA